MPKPAVTWLVRYVDERGVLAVKTFYTEEAATGFIRRLREAGVDVRSWAEVRTQERDLPA